MYDQLPPLPASEPGDKPARPEYLAGAGPAGPALAGAGPAEAGDSACWAQFVCAECGAMLSADSGHAEGCHLRDM